MKKLYAAAFALLLTFLAVPGAHAGSSKQPSKGTLVKVQDPRTELVRCFICSDDGTLCVEVSCGGS